MVKVLFVCLGNICRSPMAEAIFQDLVKKKGYEGKIEVDSAGTGGWHTGNPPHEGTRKILGENSISFEGIAARQIVKEDLSKFDYIIGMDTENVGNIRRLAGYNKTGYVGRLLDFVPHIKEDDVPDPYYTGNFNEVYTLVAEGCNNLFEHVIKEKFEV